MVFLVRNQWIQKVINFVLQLLPQRINPLLQLLNIVKDTKSSWVQEWCHHLLLLLLQLLAKELVFLVKLGVLDLHKREKEKVILYRVGEQVELRELALLVLMH
jgi:ABC-type proline/glycine betaine transport system permease subunit